MNKDYKKLNTPLIIFDFDGTICDSFNHSLELLNAYCIDKGYKTIDYQEIEQFRSMTILESLKRLGIPKWRLPFLMNHMKYELKTKMSEMKPYEGIKELLFELKKKGLSIVLLTSNSSENVECFLNMHNINLFDVLYTGSSIFGKARLLRKIIKNSNINPIKDKVLYIGDELRDIIASKKASIESISVTWGAHSESLLKKHNPHYIFNTPQDLSYYFKNEI